MKETLSEIREYIINETDIQKQIAEGEGIEFSYTGELVPFEVVEGKFKRFIKEILDEIDKRHFPEDYTSREFKLWMKLIIKQKAGFEELE